MHISDIHFRGDQPIPWRERFEGWMECFPGLVGERWNRVTGLALAFANLRTDSQGANPRLLVSGDFTAWGAENQLDRAIRFLEDHVTATGDTDEKYNEPIGLMEKDWRHWSMPGNHDHWSAPLRSFCRSMVRGAPGGDARLVG
jgi:hypothetical protein